MFVTIGEDDYVTMPVRVKTDAEEINSLIVCPITATLTSTKPFISVATDSSEIIVNSASV